MQDTRSVLLFSIFVTEFALCSGFVSPSLLSLSRLHLVSSKPLQQPKGAHRNFAETLEAKYPDGISYGTLPGVETGSAGVVGLRPNRQFALPQPAPSSSELMGESRLFVDSAEVSAWNLLDLGIFYGVTTNPVLLERAGVGCSVESLREMADAAFSLGAREFMCQAWGQTALQMMETGEQLASIDSRVVVKVPLTGPGIQAATALARKGVRVCATGCYAPHQVITAVAAGAEYVAPYLGRMNDAGKDGVEAVAKMQQIVDGMGSRTRVLVASVREVEQMEELAARGCTTFTVSPDVGKALLEEEQTMAAAADFERAAEAMKGVGKKQIGFAL